MHREQLLGQLLTLGFTGTEVTADLRALAQEIRPGGFILFRRNVTTPDADRRLTGALQKLAGAELPAFLGVDQEGGTVARLRAPFYTEFPGNRALLADYRATGTAGAAKAQGRILAAELAMAGFNWNYAPVLDVDSNPVNPVIGKRAFSAQPDEVAALGVALAQALEAGGVLSCGKHAPGHGNTALDSHHDLPIEDVALATLRARELKPFQAYARAGLASLMTAHVVYSQFDPQHPGTLSEPVIQGLVRKEIGFDGLVVTDDLEMKAIDGRYGPEDAALRAVAAGCDVLLICHTPEKQLRAHAALVAEDRKSPALRARVDAALGRITRLKKRLTAPPAFDPAMLAHADAAQFVAGLARAEAAARAADPTEYRG
jgi:beta-N-acetylhexosaminidase